MDDNYICSQCGHQGKFVELAYWTDAQYKCPKCFGTVKIQKKHNAPYLIKTNSQNKKIVAIVIDGLYIAGVQRHCIQLSEFFKMMNYQVMIIATEGGGMWYKKFVDIADYLFVPSIQTHIHWKNIESVFGVDVIKRIAFCSCHLVSPIYWAITEMPFNIKLFAHYHSEPSEHEMITTSIFKKTYIRASRIFFPSLKTLNAYKAIFDFDDKYYVFPNGFFNISSLCNKKIQNKDKVIRIAIISRIDCDKFSIKLFKESILELKKRNIFFKIVIAGNGDSMFLLKNVIKSLEIGEMVDLLGFLDEPTELYQWADLVFLPSKRESMPYVMLESIECQTPIVLPQLGNVFEGSTIPGVFEFITDDFIDAVDKIIMAKEFSIDLNNKKLMVNICEKWTSKWESEAKKAYELDEGLDSK